MEKATAILFFCFSLAVAFANVLIGRYYALAIILPFALACVFNGKKSKLMEVIGLLFSGILTLIMGEIYVGILILIVASCLFYSLQYNRNISRVYLAATGIAVIIASYFNTIGSNSNYAHAMLDGMLYCVCSGALLINVYCCIDKMKPPEKPLDQKYLEVIDELRDLAHESIDKLKQMNRRDI